MLDPQLIAMLRCPQTGQALREAEPELVAEINQQVAAGTLRDVGERLVEEPLTGGLVCESGEYLYPVREEIPTLIPDWAIRREGLAEPTG